MVIAGTAGVPSRGGGVEDSLLRSLEDRRRGGGSTTTANWSPSVPGEQPPLAPAVPDGLGDRGAGGGRGGQAAYSVARLKWMRLNLLTRKAQGDWGVVPADDSRLTESNVLEAVAENVDSADAFPGMTDDNEGDGDGDGNDGGIFDGVGGENPEVGLAVAADTDMDRLINGAAVVDDLFADDDDSSIATSCSNFSEMATEGESLPLTDAGRDRRRRKRRRARRWRKWLRRTFHTHVWEALYPSVVGPLVSSFLTGIFLFGIAPLLAVAAFLFYLCGNPTPDFLESDSGASLSYMLIFVARQLTTRALGGMSAYILVQVLAMKSKLAVKLFGPHFTILLINAEGWPLRATCWVIWDLILLQGNNTFQQNWLFFADIRIFSPDNPGGDILSNTVYGRALAALLVIGLATSFKRTLVAIYFGKKLFRRYKHGLEKLLIGVLVVSEVAELSKEMEEAFDDDEDDEGDKNRSRRTSLRTTRTRWTSISKGFQSQEKKSVAFDGDDDTDGDSDDQNMEGSNLDRKGILTGSAYQSQCASEVIGIKSLLVGWEEPTNKLDKESDPSISDMLLFRKALAFMDGQFPFSSAFGPASTRDECISSAQDTYQRLMFIAPEATNLSFDVLAVLALDETGGRDQKKHNMLRRTFRPDRFNELSELAFVQSCDSVYSKLRYFRASVGNSSVIDKVIQDAMEKVFGFLLVLVTCVIMHYNPWALLVSLSTLVVSMSFAVGAATSKYIEGILLIVARSPYEIGDRIMIVGSENTTSNGTQYSWFVEDVNLYSTTLRFAATNEVATITNGSIAASRIINCARSSKALITLTLKYTLYINDEQAAALENALKQYVKDLPRQWAEVIYFRSDELDADYEYIEYTMRIQHRKTWQDATEIAKDKAKLLKFMHETASELDIIYDSPMRRIRLYRPGEKEGWATSDAKTSDTLMTDAIQAAGLETLLD